MDNTFLVVVNLSKAVKNCEKGSYTMLVDGSKMTFVFEFSEWIRWLFDLKGCVYISYMNTVIHGFEGVDILSRFKNIEVETCTSPSCKHELKHPELFNLVKFYDNWNNFRVPKIISQRLQLVIKKSANGIFSRKSDEEISSLANLNEQSQKKFQVVETDVVNESCGRKINNIEPSPITLKSPKESNLVSQNSDSSFKTTQGSPASSNHVENICNPFENFTSGLKNASLNCSTQKINREKSHNESNASLSLSPPADNKNKAQVKGKRTGYHLKPFTIGDLLNSIRTEVKGSPTDTTHSSTLNTSELTFENDSSGVVEQDGNEVTNGLSKKRKRIRKHKGKKKASIEDFSFNESSRNSSFGITVEPAFKSSQAKHIRFERDEVFENPEDEQEKAENLNGFVEPERKPERLSLSKEQPVQAGYMNEVEEQPINGAEEGAYNECPEKTSETNGFTDASDVLEELLTLKKKCRSLPVFDRFVPRSA